MFMLPVKTGLKISARLDPARKQRQPPTAGLRGHRRHRRVLCLQRPELPRLRSNHLAVDSGGRNIPG